MPRETTASQQKASVPPADFWKWAWAAVRPLLGWVFTGLGFLLLVIAYLGVSGEVLVAKQLPYLVSGGLTGLALITLGSRLLLIEDLRRDSGRLNRLESMVEELHLALLSRPDSPVPHSDHVLEPASSSADVSTNGRRPTQETDVVVLPGGASFHRDDCSVVAGKPSNAMPAATARERGLRACRVCQPLAVRLTPHP